MDPITGSLIAGGAALAGQGINAVSQGSMNRATRRWNEQQYEKQKQDNLDFWNLQNSYNSLQQQMARLSAAGLNPNLVYGNGSVANSTSAPNVPSAMPYRPEAPSFNLPQIFDSYFNVQSRQQQLSNEKQIGNNLALDALIKTEEARSKSMSNSYMQDHGYGFKRHAEGNSANLIFQRMLAQNALNAFNFGDTGSMSDPIAKGSNYDLQARGLGLVNNLRSLEVDNKKSTNAINAVKSKYTERLMSGKFKDLSAKDILMLFLNGVQTYKK